MKFIFNEVPECVSKNIVLCSLHFTVDSSAVYHQQSHYTIRITIPMPDTIRNMIRDCPEFYLRII